MKAHWSVPVFYVSLGALALSILVSFLTWLEITPSGSNWIFIPLMVLAGVLAFLTKPIIIPDDLDEDDAYNYIQEQITDKNGLVESLCAIGYLTIAGIWFIVMFNMIP